MIGQDHVTTPLRRALRAGRVGHAYLFSGPRGCGKTTSARILARCLNCAEGPTDTPCGTCDSCRDLARGGAGSLDVVEIDAASHGGVDDARELRERASFAPVRDRFKVFIIDEAHMVTSAGFNALLKLVEEPPDHVKFVFATTEPDKVIGTIRSRTHHYPFRLIPPQVLGPYLEEVCAAESVQVGEGVMPLVVRAGGGSARDSMSVLDQLMAGAGETGLDFETAIALLGFTDTALLDTAITAVAERDAAALYGAVEHVLATGHEPRRFVEDLLERMRDLIVLAAVPDKSADLLPQVPADELERMRGQATLFAPADLSQCGDLVHETLSTMSGATSPRLHLELLAARLVLRDERAALAAGDGAASAGARPANAPSVSGGRPGSAQQTSRGGESATAGSGATGAREEARRIAQQKAEAARQARSGGAPAPSEGRQRQGAAPEQAAARPQQSGTQQPGAQQSGTQWAPGPDAKVESQVEEQHAPHIQASGGQEWAAASQQPAPASTQPAPPVQPAQERHHDAPSQPAPEAPAAAPSGDFDADAVRTHWSAILDELQQIRRPSWALVSQNAHVHNTQGSTLVLGFRTEGLVNAFRRGTAGENLADAVRRIMHTEVSVDAVVGEDPGPGGAGGGSTGGGMGGGPSGGPGGGVPSAGGPAGQQNGAPQAGAPTNGAADRGAPQAAGRQQDASAPRSGGTWGDAVSAMAPRPSAAAPAQTAPEEPVPSAGQRASDRAMKAAARAAQNNVGGRSAEPVEDFAPEPDDPYPPDPQDSYAPAPSAPPAPQSSYSQASAVPSSAPQQSGSRWSDALEENAPAAAEAPAPTSATAPAYTSAPAAAPASAGDGEIPVVEDEGRDSLPADEPRTYGQNALKRAIAEGRLIHSRPSESAAAAPSSSTPTADPLAADIPMPADVPPPVDSPASPVSPVSPASPASPGSASGSPGPAPVTGGDPSQGGSSTPGQRGDAVTGSASERAAASWGATPSVTSMAPGSASVAAALSAAPRSGAALAREAAQASRAASQRGKGQQPGAPEQAPADTDPTGGATRDDDDAVVANRNGREIIETLLGGKVLEVIDENRPR